MPAEGLGGHGQGLEQDVVGPVPAEDLPILQDQVGAVEGVQLHPFLRLCKEEGDPDLRIAGGLKLAAVLDPGGQGHLEPA